MSAIRGVFAANVSGDLPPKFWPDQNAPLLYEASVNLTAGPSGVGKSNIVRRIVADVTRAYAGGPGRNVIYGNLEDAIEMQAYGLRASGADMDKVRLASFSIPGELADLEIAIRNDAAALVVFDTAQKHIEGPIQRWDRPLGVLTQLLARTNCSAMFIHHTNKNVRQSADWRAAIGGQTAGLIGTARHIALIGQRPDDSSQLVYCPVKDSYSETPKALAFEFGDEDFDQSDGRSVSVAFMRIAEKDLVIPNPTQLVHIAGRGDGSRGPSPEKAAEAAEFLTEALKGGVRSVKDVYRCLTNPDSTSTLDDPKRQCGYKSIREVEKNGGTCPDCGGAMQATPGLMTEAEAAGVSWGTIKRAKDALTIVTNRKGFGEAGVFFWRLPDGHPKLAPNAPDILA